MVKEISSQHSRCWASNKFEVFICHTPILTRLNAEAGQTDIAAYTNQLQDQSHVLPQPARRQQQAHQPVATM